MKRLPILKRFVDLLNVLLTLAIAVCIPFFIVMVVKPEVLSSEIFDVKPTDIPTIEIIILIVSFSSIVFAIHALRLFSRTLIFFRNGDFFDIQVSKNFKAIGKAIIIGYIISFLPWFIYDNVTTSVIPFSDFGDLITDTLFMGALGLFFIVLSEVFLAAGAIKQENDLTV